MAKMGRPKVEKPKNKMIGLRLSEEEYERFKKYAESKGMTVTSVLYAKVNEILASKAV